MPEYPPRVDLTDIIQDVVHYFTERPVYNFTFKHCAQLTSLEKRYLQKILDNLVIMSLNSYGRKVRCAAWDWIVEDIDNEVVGFQIYPHWQSA